MKEKEKRKVFSTIIGNELHQMRLSKDMTTNDMGLALNISQAMVYYYEKGMRLPGVKNLETYAKVFNLDFEQLMQMRIETIKETVENLGADAPPYLVNEYELIRYYEALLCVRN